MKRGPKPDLARRRRIVRAYRKVRSLRIVGSRFGVSHEAIRRHLIRAGEIRGHDVG